MPGGSRIKGSCNYKNLGIIWIALPVNDYASIRIIAKVLLIPLENDE
jgi:hypothetical protein